MTDFGPMGMPLYIKVTDFGLMGMPLYINKPLIKLDDMLILGILFLCSGFLSADVTNMVESFQDFEAFLKMLNKADYNIFSACLKTIIIDCLT